MYKPLGLPQLIEPAQLDNSEVNSIKSINLDDLSQVHQVNKIHILGWVNRR